MIKSALAYEIGALPSTQPIEKQRFPTGEAKQGIDVW
jgi:hypothetical protein